MNKTYTFVALVDSVSIGRARGCSIEEIEEMMTCGMTHDLGNPNSECWSCADSARFIESLRNEGVATLVHYEPEGESVAVAYYEAQQRPF